MTTIPTLAELYTSILNDLQSEFTITIPVFGPALLRALALAQAAKLKLLYLFVGSVQKNIFVDTADPDQVTRWGQVQLGRGPFPATQAQYAITITGTIGTTVPAGAVWKSDDDSLNPGKLYILDVAYTTVNDPDNITVRALVAGKDSELSIGDTLTATAPIPLIGNGAEVDSEIVVPQDAENVEDYRAKTLINFRLEPQGGAPGDYRLWSLDAQGVKQAYPYAASGAPNEVNVYVEATIVDSTDGKGTPTAGILSDVEDDIELDPDTTLPIEERGRRPLTVFSVNVLAITPLDVDIEIVDYVNGDAAKEALILAQLTETCAGIRPFIAGADPISSRNDVLDVNRVISAILAAVPGSIFDSVNLSVDGSPVSTFTFDNGNIPYLNSVTYV